ncbi:MAG: SBBP repeat-containing protein [Candidatus Acidiferrum sp.]
MRRSFTIVFLTALLFGGLAPRQLQAQNTSLAPLITTVAGNGIPGYSGDNGPATSAQLLSPVGLAMDTAGNPYIGEMGSNRVRKVDTSGIITTVAGNGNWGYRGDNSLATSAALRSPRGIAVDSAGNIYIADSANYRIRKVDATTGVITTVEDVSTEVWDD